MAFAQWRLLYFAFVFALGGGLLDSFSLECGLLCLMCLAFGGI